jgi:hypothetical protein
MWSSAETLQTVASWALVTAVAAAIVGAIAGAIGTIASSRASDLSMRDATIKIAEANARAEEASGKAAEARKEAEALRLRVEQEKVERLRLEERVQPRQISGQQKALISQALKTSPKGRVYINPDWMDPEAKMYADQIADVLEPLGYILERLTGDSAPLSYGKLGQFLIVRDTTVQPAQLMPLYLAFKSAGVIFDLYADQYVPDHESVLIGISSH